MSDETEDEKRSTTSPPLPRPDFPQSSTSHPAEVSVAPTQAQHSPQPPSHGHSATPSVVSPHRHDNSPPSSSHRQSLTFIPSDKRGKDPDRPFASVRLSPPRKSPSTAPPAAHIVVPSPPQISLLQPAHEVRMPPCQQVISDPSPPGVQGWTGESLSYPLQPDTYLAYSGQQLGAAQPQVPCFTGEGFPPQVQFAYHQQQQQRHERIAQRQNIAQRRQRLAKEEQELVWEEEHLTQQERQPPGQYIIQQSTNFPEGTGVYMMPQEQPFPTYPHSFHSPDPRPMFSAAPAAHFLSPFPPHLTTSLPLVPMVLTSGEPTSDAVQQHLSPTPGSYYFPGSPLPPGASMPSLDVGRTAHPYDTGASGHPHEEATKTSAQEESNASRSGAEDNVSQLRTEAQEFVPRESGQQQQQRRLLPARTQRKQKHYSKRKTAPPTEAKFQAIKQQLRVYAVRTLTHSSDPEDPEALEEVKRTVRRVPAVCFNEQKFEDREGYKVLLQPQSPAVRGQEALSRVCFVLEQILRQRNKGAAIISDYKYKENYLRHAPQDVLEVLQRPTEEGSHDILMIAPEIGIVCVQVNCIEMSTNSGTVRKQVRETLKQLQKDKRVVKHLLEDLDLNCGVHMVMALPNITSQLLKQKLDASFVQTLAAVLETTEDLENLLTLDRLPCVGHCHWSSRESRDEFLQWFKRLVARGTTLHVENYMQIFARYTCSWSVAEVWGMTKPRVQIRIWAHAVSETFCRYHLPVLTPMQDDLLRSGQSHVLMKGPSGCGATSLLKVKATMELQRGYVVLVFVSRQLTGLRREYEDFSDFLSAEHSGSVYFWSCEEGGAEVSESLFTPRTGEARTLDSLRAEKREMFALFDRPNRDSNLSRIVGEITDLVTSVWVAMDAPMTPQLELPEGKYHTVQFTTLTRVPTSVQALIKYGLQEADARAARTTISTEFPSTSLSLLKNLRSVAEVSSYQGLPTDGPTPLFIFHPSGTSAASPPENNITGCSRCMTQLRAALMDLVGDFTQRISTAERSDEAISATAGGQQIASGPLTTEQTETAGSSTSGSAGEAREEEEETVGEAGGLDINAGNVPRPLKVEDVVIFADSVEDVDTIVKMLDLVNVERAVRPLADLPQLIGTERAVVGYVGRVDAGTDRLMHALVSKLCDVMTLCQGQLILALEFTPDADHEKTETSTPRKQPAPYQLEIESMQEQAQKQHN